MENDKRGKDGKFLPGIVPPGRPKGAKNKTTKEVKERFQQLVDSYSLEQMKIDLMELEPGERLRIITGLLDFFIPKLNRTDHNMTVGEETIVIRLPQTEKEHDHRPIEQGPVQRNLPPATE
jgi:hypothetical protein